jgi:putative hydrolase of the HAD superfamily
LERQWLIFDADDTLWENNIYFEDAFDRFCKYLDHSHMSPEQIRSVLDEIETANAKIHGYGSRNFARNLATCLQHLAERDITTDDLQAVEQFAYAILDAPMQLLDGVSETVEALAARHDLTLFTKGDPNEQQLKIDRSGLASFFNRACIVKEKNTAAYIDLTTSNGMDRANTWMIGNSPKSDINPALTAGLFAVYVPHPRTWSLEREEIPDHHPRLRRVRDLRELIDIF